MMKENRYDDEAFFGAYGKMERSARGLAAAGEWPAFRALMPALAGRRVLDLGCGYGWHCRYAAEQGAAEVVGTDLSERMLAEARRQTDAPQVRYIRGAIEDIDFPSAYFDVVLSSLAFHYVADFSDVCRRVWRITAPGGRFLFSAEHPVFTAAGPQHWHCDEAGRPLHWPVDRYFDEGPRSADFLGHSVQKVHRTITSYFASLADAGFAVRRIVEPQPTVEALQENPAFAEELRRPMMIIFSAEKPVSEPAPTE